MASPPPPPPSRGCLCRYAGQEEALSVRLAHLKWSCAIGSD